MIITTESYIFLAIGAGSVLLLWIMYAVYRKIKHRNRLKNLTTLITDSALISKVLNENLVKIKEGLEYA